MIFDWLDKARRFKDELPNKFSIAMGEKVRKARLEAKNEPGRTGRKFLFQTGY